MTKIRMNDSSLTNTVHFTAKEEHNSQFLIIIDSKHISTLGIQEHQSQNVQN